MGAALLKPRRVEVDDPAATVLDLQARIRAMQGADLGENRLPTLPAIAELLPEGALIGGSAYQVRGSMTLLQAMLAGVSLAGGWCAVLGMPDFGAEAAAALGVDLERLILVPHPGERWWPALSTLVETVGAVAVRPLSAPTAGDLARLQGKLRTHETLLLVDGDWPASRATLSVRRRRADGLGRGWGLLGAREMEVETTARGRSRVRGLHLADGELVSAPKVQLARPVAL
ncbi:putative protein OS=Leifsonia shinshuensis OX=150026 GN=F1C12_03830 PE=4 SV=1 [Leifsonia shinshuensis]